MRPVGRITCSLNTPPVSFISHGPGVAETNTDCGRIASHSLKRSGRLSMQLGRRKPYSASVIFRRWSPRAIAPICGTVWWLSSTNSKRIVGQIFEQGRRRLAGQAAGEEARIILDARAAAGRGDHLQVEIGPLLEPLRLQQPPFRLQLLQPLGKLVADRLHRLLERRAGRHIVRIGEHPDGIEAGGLLAGQRIELGDLLHLVAEEADPPGAVLIVRRENLQIVAAHPEIAAGEGLARCACTAARPACG